MDANSVDRVGLIVVAAGKSTRMGAIDKVWAPLDGHAMVWYSLVSLTPHADTTVLVVGGPRQDHASETLLPDFPNLRICCGGRERRDSVASGLRALGDVEVVAIHDAARPLIDASILLRGIELVREWDVAIPVVPVHDTIKEVDAAGRVVQTLDRNRIRAVQTPQVFKHDALKLAHTSAPKDHPATDDASLLEMLGYSVTTFLGAHENFKVTTLVDLALAEMFIRKRAGR